MIAAVGIAAVMTVVTAVEATVVLDLASAAAMTMRRVMMSLAAL